MPRLIGLQSLGHPDAELTGSIDILPNNGNFVELLDNLIILAEEIKAEYKNGTHQVEIPQVAHHGLAIQEVRRAQQSVDSSMGNTMLVPEVQLEHDEVSVDEKEASDKEEPETQLSEHRGTKMSDQSSITAEVGMSGSSKYRLSKLARSSSMEWKSLEFQEGWSQMPEAKVSEPSTSWKTLRSFGSSFSKRSSNSRLSEVSTADSAGCLIYPSSTRKLLWDILGLFFIGLEIIVLPLQLFSDEDKNSTLYIILNVFSLVYWSVDLFASFMTAYYTGHGDLEKRKLFIARNYLKTWFTIDFICVLIDVLTLSAQGVKSTTGFVRFVKILKFFRMVRIFKVNDRMTSSEGRIRSEVTLISIRIVKLLLILFFTCHCMACGWWAVGKYYNKSRHNWIDHALDAKEGEDTGSFRDRSFGYRYSVCFHWALSQFVAASEIFPTNTAERGYAVLCGAIALVGFGSMIAGMTSSIVEITERRNRGNRDELKLRTFMVQHEIPSKLRAQKMKKLATSAMQEHAVGLGAELFLVGEDSHEMYFITKGKLWYNFMKWEEEDNIRERQGSVMKLQVAPDTDPSWACELALYVKWKHHGIMEASEATELITLNAAEFTKTMHKEVDVHKYARALLDVLRQNPGQTSDVMSADIVINAFEQSRF